MQKFVPSYLGQDDPSDLATESTLSLVRSGTDNLDIPLSQVSISIASAAGLTDVQLRATPVPISGPVTLSEPISVDDSGGSLTVDGSVAVTNFPATQPVSGSVTATVANLDVGLSTRTKPSDQQHAIVDSGTLTNLSQLGGSAISMNSGTRDAGTQRVTIATNDSVPVTGTFWQGTQPVSLATAPVLVAGSALIGKVGIDQTTPGTTNAVQVVGGAADATNALLATAVKPIASSTYAPSLFQNLGANATLNVKASTGNVFSLTCYNANAASRYIQLHNTATTPAGAAVPIYSFLVPSLSQVVIGSDFFTTMGVNFSTGIAFAFSTTINTYTAGVAGEQSTFIQYK